MTNFQGLTVLTLESRRGQEMARLIETYGGKTFHAPAMREVPLASNTEALKFVDALFEGKIDTMIFLTGVGARALSGVVEGVHPVEKFFGALRRVSVLARIDNAGQDLRGKRVAVQEYGVANPELLSGLRERGAVVTRVPIYQWALPEDTGPLRVAVDAVIAGQVDVALFTTGVQVQHLFQIAEEAGRKEALKTGLEGVVKASIWTYNVRGAAKLWPVG